MPLLESTMVMDEKLSESEKEIEKAQMESRLAEELADQRLVRRVYAKTTSSSSRSFAIVKDSNPACTQVQILLEITISITQNYK